MTATDAVANVSGQDVAEMNVVAEDMLKGYLSKDFSDLGRLEAHGGARPC